VSSAAGAVVLGGYVNALGVVRALADQGLAVAVVTTRRFDIAHRSRSCVAHLDAVGCEEEPEELVEQLERRAAEWAGWALFATNDWTLAALSHHHERLSRHFRVVVPSPEAVAVVLDKRRTREAAIGLGVLVPRCYGPADAATTRDAAIHFPVLVKPLEGHRFAATFGAKLFVAADHNALATAVEKVTTAGIACEVLDWIPGGDDQIYAHNTYLDATGEPRGGVTIRKLRQSPAGFGVARVAEIAPESTVGLAQLRAAAVAILRHIGLRGMATVEFKRDPRDGTFRLFEINGRAVLYNSLIRRAGLDLAGLAWADFVEGRPRTAEPQGWPGVWVNLHADVLHSAFSRRRERLGLRDFLAPYRRPWIDAVWSPRDPRPFLHQWAWTARRGAAALFARNGARVLADPTDPR
jgi:predicted ATP-grasp superfamily ATP-dependent carboligase